MSRDATPVVVSIPQTLHQGLFSLEILGERPNPAVYKPGTQGFLYWNAFDALHRSAKFWRGVLERARSRAKDWYRAKESDPHVPLRVALDHGDDLNAYYDRRGLLFFRAMVSGRRIYSGESPDVLAHELGHAVLDSIQPKLWNAASDEIAAFHESFGDISSICTALQLESLRRAAIEEPGATFYRSSRISRLAEQLGWAIRQVRTDASETDCLRNAVNCFFYQPPHTLPPEAPSATLSSEPHSFSRVFTAGFFGALSDMFDGRKKNGRPNADDLLEVTNDAALLLVKSVEAAPVIPDFYSEVALGMLRADKDEFDGRYANAIRSAFMRRGILPLNSATAALRFQAIMPRQRRSYAATVPAMAAEAVDVEEGKDAGLLRLLFFGEAYGIAAERFYVSAAIEEGEYRRGVAPISNEGVTPTQRAEEDAHSFVANLVRRNKIDREVNKSLNNITDGMHPMLTIPNQLGRKTHVLIRDDGEVSLVRRMFE
jgi:hypothetical protein